MSRHSSCFVEFSLVTHASVSPYMLQECKVLHNSPSALELTLFVFDRLFYFLLSPRSYSCSGKKWALPPLEPLVDHRPMKRNG